MVSPFKKKHFVFLLCFSIMGLFQFISMTAFGADAVISQSLSFGSIDLHPSGDTITIAANAGPAFPVPASGSVVTGGWSGLITVTSPIVEHVDIIYPVSVTMVSGVNNLTIDSIEINSQYNAGGADTLGGGIPLTISVGGRISIPAGQANGSYSAQVPIILNYS